MDDIGRGGSRIPPGNGAPTYDFAKKLHETEKILDRRGLNTGDGPPICQWLVVWENHRDSSEFHALYIMRVRSGESQRKTKKL